MKNLQNIWRFHNFLVILPSQSEIRRNESRTKAKRNRMQRYEKILIQTNKLRKIMKKQIWTSAMINKTFLIKINGFINGVYRSMAIGVSRLLELLGGKWERLERMVSRADKLASQDSLGRAVCAIYGTGIVVRFYYH